MKALTGLTILAAAIILVSTPAIVSAQVHRSESLALEVPDSFGDPDLFDPAKHGYVDIEVYIDEGIVEPLNDVQVLLFNADYDLIDVQVTDEVGEASFIARAGSYIVRVEYDRDHRERVIELPSGGSAGTETFLFDYNVGSSGSMLEGETEPACPGIAKISVAMETGGLVMLIPDAEVQLTSSLGEVERVGFTNRYGKATFVIQEGFYNIAVLYDGEVQSRWVFIGCGETVEGIYFYFE
jgi:hypothetical protein